MMGATQEKGSLKTEYTKEKLERTSQAGRRQWERPAKRKMTKRTH